MKKYLKAEALAAIRKGEISTGIEKYLEYLALDPNKADDDAWAGLGGAYRRDGRISEAIDAYRHAFDLNPDSTYALVNLVSLQTARGTAEDRARLQRDIPEAIRLCREVIEQGAASFWTWYDLATLHLLRGDRDESMKLLHHAVALTPEGAKENFRSVLKNLQFLQSNRPDIPGIEDAISLVSEHA